MKTPFFIIAVSLLAVSLASALEGCAHSSRTDKELERAEQLMTERPDSSLILLKDIEPGQLGNDRERAMYGLLLTMAEDKNWLDPANDSIISFAAGYFAKTGDTDRLIKSQYYRGRVRYINKNYPEALVCFYEAKETAEQSQDYFWAGMACRGISDIFNKTANKADELLYAQKEFDNLSISTVQPYLNYALLDLCRAQINSGDNDTSLKMVEQLKDSAIKYNDRNLYLASLRLQGNALYKKENYEKAAFVYEELCKTTISTVSDTLKWCVNLIESGRKDRAQELLQQIRETQDPLYNDALYLIYKKSGYFDKALEEIEKERTKENLILRDKVNLLNSESVINYYKLQKELEEAENRYTRTRLFAVIFISALLILILAYLLYRIIRHHYQTEQYKQELIEDIKDRLNQKNNELLDASQKANEIFLSSTSIIKELSDLVARQPAKKVNDKMVKEKIQNIVENFFNPSNIRETEEKIDETADNLIAKFKTDLPDLKEKYYQLFILLVLRFSTQSIVLLLKEKNVKAVYNLKRRLRQKINGLDETKRTYYLSYFK